MSIVFYCILTFAAYRSCDHILASFTQVHGIDQNVTREEIDRIYMKISNSIGSKTLDNRLVQHRNELHRNMFTISRFEISVWDGQSRRELENWQKLSQKSAFLKLKSERGIFRKHRIFRAGFGMDSTPVWGWSVANSRCHISYYFAINRIVDP